MILAPDVNDLGRLGFVCQTEKVNSRVHMLFSLLASLFTHRLYIALEGSNGKKFY